jgi:hypothetical protein
MSPFDTELAVISNFKGFREITVLKFPLVPRTHPRVWKSRPISVKARATAGRVGNFMAKVRW